MSRIKILITSSEASMWYINQIGNIIEVYDNKNKPYYTYKGIRIIFKSDTKRIIKKAKKSN